MLVLDAREEVRFPLFEVEFILEWTFELEMEGVLSIANSLEQKKEVCAQFPSSSFEEYLVSERMAGSCSNDEAPLLCSFALRESGK